MEDHGTFDEPWAATFEPGTANLFITEKPGRIKFYRTESGTLGSVRGVPHVDYGGQGGLGDIAFAPDYTTSRAVYISWVEAGEGDTRGAAVGRGTLVCEERDSCDIRNLKVIWRQFPKVTGRGHFSHRMAFSPDGKYLFVASGERQKMAPAQDVSNTLGTIVRLNLDGSAAAGNPLSMRGSPSNQIWTWGHRNILGLAFDSLGQLWEVEHGPRGGDELNFVEAGKNYGWPEVSEGRHYSGVSIPSHSTRPEFTPPVLSWDPVIAPGDMTFITSGRFPGWKGNLVIVGLGPKVIVRVAFEGTRAREVARYTTQGRNRAIVEGPDGALWLLENGPGGRLLKLVPSQDNGASNGS